MGTHTQIIMSTDTALVHKKLYPLIGKRGYNTNVYIRCTVYMDLDLQCIFCK